MTCVKQPEDPANQNVHQTHLQIQMGKAFAPRNHVYAVQKVSK